MRKWVFMFFVLNLVLLLSWISGLPKQTFDLLGIYLIHSSLMALAMVLLSFWVWKDGNEIEHLHGRMNTPMRRYDDQIKDLQRMIDELSKASPKETSARIEEIKTQCPKCGKKVPLGFKLCPHCGFDRTSTN